MPRLLIIAIAVLFLAWLASVAVLLSYFAALVGIPALVATGVAWVGIPPVLIALMIFTNTRRPAGIDPNARPVDPFGQTTAELRDAVMVGERPYGRRNSDDVEVVKRLINKLEQDDSERPPPPATPKWALDLASEHDASGLFPDPPREI